MDSDPDMSDSVWIKNNVSVATGPPLNNGISSVYFSSLMMSFRQRGSCLLMISPILPSLVWSINKITDRPKVVSRKKGSDIKILPRAGTTLLD